MVEKVELTREGLEKLQKEYDQLVKVDRPRVIEEIAAARAQGDLSENADYDAARNKQAEIEAKIKDIENIFANVKVIDGAKKTGKIVALGTTVDIKDLSDGSVATYKIVGTVEANPIKGLVSNASPLGTAIVGHHVGDICTVKVAKEYSVEILKIVQ